MPPASTPTSAGRQTTLLGFFSKPSPGSSVPARSTPKTPNTSTKPTASTTTTTAKSNSTLKAGPSLSRNGSQSDVVVVGGQESPLTNKGKGKGTGGFIRSKSDAKSGSPIRVEQESTIDLDMDVDVDVDVETGVDEDVFTAPSSTLFSNAGPIAKTPPLDPPPGIEPTLPLRPAVQSSSPLSELEDLPAAPRPAMREDDKDVDADMSPDHEPAAVNEREDSPITASVSRLSSTSVPLQNSC